MKPFLCRIAKGIRLVFDWLMSMVDALFNKHRLVRRIIVFIALALITFSVYVIIPKLDGGNAVTALGLVIGILTPVLAFYKWQRDKDGD